MDYRKSYLLLQAGVLGGAVIVFLGLCIGMKLELPGSILAAIGLVGMLGGIGQALAFYKCPSCGRRFSIRGRKPDFCPGCGCKLEQ